ncbi:class I SAM-dependent methyltransferase [Streptomyces sp. NBC_01198]|uniref:class I SAM-dependent methyltransferase n=1 Tax=Streptomyces sp. NBC_01198 TaxID=2903769 RepID=UPI002E0EDCA7|nr:class I SAM-dependent methyltransferase [Streptomyces sp. NBC_01198]
MGTDGTGYDPELYARRRESFGAAAAEYAAHRPDYPAEAIAWALAPAGDAGALDVLDLAAGTGKLSRSLVALGHRVTAVEPDTAMLDELRRRVPEATAVVGSAERIPLPDASVDAVLVGQAIHWFDQGKALPEIARVLRPGGPLATLSNADDDRVEWIAGLGDVSPSQVSYLGWATSPGRRIEQNPAFSATEDADFPHALRRTADSLVATVATHSHMLVLDPAEREAAKERVREYLRSRPETSAGEFDLRLVTRVQRCVRAGG